MTTNITDSTILDCGHTPTQPRHEFTTGYATLPDGKRLCFACADEAQRAELKDRSKPFVAYLSKDTITTWTGGKLMTVTESRPCELTRVSYTHDRRTYRSVHCVDVHGGHWTGRGSDGIAIKLRAVKG